MHFLCFLGNGFSYTTTYKSLPLKQRMSIKVDILGLLDLAGNTLPCAFLCALSPRADGRRVYDLLGKEKPRVEGLWGPERPHEGG